MKGLIRNKKVSMDPEVLSKLQDEAAFEDATTKFDSFLNSHRESTLQ